MLADAISKKQIALLIEVLVGKPANPNDRILAHTDFESMNAALTAALQEAASGDQPVSETALADAAKRLDAGVEAASANGAALLDDATADLDAVAAAERKAAPRTVKVRAGLADKPRIKKGATIRADGLEEGGPDAILVDAVRQPGGALHSDLCQLVGGWKKCDRRLARAAALVGLTLRSIREGSDTRFEVA